MEEDLKFNLSSIEETFANYKKNNIYDIIHLYYNNILNRYINLLRN